MSRIGPIQGQIDRLWVELTELRQSLNARPIAPTPDYRSDLPADDPCSCEESERLKAELGEAHVENTELRRLLVRRVEASRLDEANTQLAAAENEMRRLGYGVEDIVCFGSAGKPVCMSRVGDLSWDTVENKRATVKWINERERVEKDLHTQLAAANALLERCRMAIGGDLGRDIITHLATQPVAPKRDDSERRLLDAMSDVGYTDLELLRDRPGESDGLKRAAAAELARRGHG